MAGHRFVVYSRHNVLRFGHVAQSSRHHGKPRGNLLAVHSGFWPLFFIAAIVVFFAAIPFVKKAMKDTGTEDPGWIVIDEVCGIFMTFAFIRPDWITRAPWILIIGFALFRFFDILKPLGIHRFEKFPGAWGVMADDLLGGIYAGILLGVPLYFI